jgi:hypothetical protein
MEPMQPSRRDAPPNGAASESDREQLALSNHAMLSIRDPGDLTLTCAS